MNRTSLGMPPGHGDQIRTSCVPGSIMGLAGLPDKHLAAPVRRSTSLSGSGLLVTLLCNMCPGQAASLGQAWHP